MNTSPAVAIRGAALAAGLLSTLLLGGTAQAVAAPEPTLSVTSVVDTGGAVTFAGTGCSWWGPESPSVVFLSVGDFTSSIPVAADGSWSHTATVDKNAGGLANDMSGMPFQVFDNPPGTYAVTAVCDQYTDDFTLTSQFTVVNTNALAVKLTPTCLQWHDCNDTIGSLQVANYATHYGGVDVTITNFVTGAWLNPSVTLTSPDGSVEVLQDTAAVLAMQAVGQPLKFGFFDDAVNTQLGVYTVTVKDSYESASATFTVVANAPTTTTTTTKTTPPGKTKDTNNLAATGVKLDVPLALSVSGLLLLVGAGALVLARRRRADHS